VENIPSSALSSADERTGPTRRAANNRLQVSLACSSPAFPPAMRAAAGAGDRFLSLRQRIPRGSCSSLSSNRRIAPASSMPSISGM
jgi:hypothetical protein